MRLLQKPGKRKGVSVTDYIDLMQKYQKPSEGTIGKSFLKVKFQDSSYVDLDLEEDFYKSRKKLPKDAKLGAENT